MHGFKNPKSNTMQTHVADML